MGEQNLLSPSFGASVAFIVISWLLMLWMLGDILITAGLLLLIAAGTGFAQVVTKRRNRGVHIKDAFYAETYAMLVTLGLLLLLGTLLKGAQPLLTYQVILFFVFPLIFAHSILSRWLRKLFSKQKTTWPHEIIIAFIVALVACLIFLAAFTVSVNIMENQSAQRLSTVPLPTNLDFNLSETREYLKIQTDLAEEATLLNEKTKAVQAITAEMGEACIVDCDHTNLLELAPAFVDIIIEYQQLNDAAAIAFSTPPEQVRELTDSRTEYELCSGVKGNYRSIPFNTDFTGIENRITLISEGSPVIRTFAEVMQGTVFWTRLSKVPDRIDKSMKGQTTLYESIQDGLKSEETAISKSLRYEVLIGIHPGCKE